MNDDLGRAIRTRQALNGVTNLRGAIREWLRRRRDADRDPAGNYVGRHKTQLQSIESVLGGAADALYMEADSARETTPMAALYLRWRQIDEAAAWLQRLWEFYRGRFDQRDDLRPAAKTTTGLPPLGPALRAADEIVWSAYHEVMKRAEALGVEHGPAPLPFVAAVNSPAAIDSGRPIARTEYLRSGRPAARRMANSNTEGLP